MNHPKDDDHFELWGKGWGLNVYLNLNNLLVFIIKGCLYLLKKYLCILWLFKYNKNCIQYNVLNVT